MGVRREGRGPVSCRLFAQIGSAKSLLGVTMLVTAVPACRFTGLVQ
jgi:hypothetical protein